MNIVFVGASKFGLRCLELLNKMDCCHVAGVVSAPKTFVTSYRPEGVTNVLHANISSFCREQGIDHAVIETDMKDTVLVERIRLWEPDALIVVSWYHMIPKIWRDIAPAYGMHASLLPDYRGGAPLVWAIINGEEKTGITLFKMDSGVDSGPIVGQMEEPIKPDDTISTLYGRIEDRGLELLEQYIPELAAGTSRLKPQDESKSRVFSQRSPEDGEIDWSLDIGKIKNFIRAQTKPYPGAYTIIGGKKIIIWDADVESMNEE